MFNLESAIVLGLVVMGLIALVKTLVEGSNRDRLVVVLCFIVAFAAVMLIVASDFAHDQVVLDRPLDSLNFASQLVVVVLVTGLATAAWNGVKALSNIGQSTNRLG